MPTFDMSRQPKFSRGKSHDGHSFQNKTRGFAAKSLKDNWYYIHNGVRLLSFYQNHDGSIVTLLRFTSSLKPFSSVTSWKLPFKLRDIQSFLLYPYLCDEEKNDAQLMEFLSSFATQQKKFETLINNRIERIITTLSDNKEKFEPRQKTITPGVDWVNKLTDEFDVHYLNIQFIEDVLSKNNIKKK